MRVCTLPDGHDDEHLPYYLAPDKDRFGNKHIAQPRCVHVVPIPAGDEPRYRIVFEIIDPSMPRAGWHEVARETSDLADAQSQIVGLAQLERDGNDVRNARIERAVVTWEPAPEGDS